MRPRNSESSNMLDFNTFINKITLKIPYQFDTKSVSQILLGNVAKIPKMSTLNLQQELTEHFLNDSKCSMSQDDYESKFSNFFGDEDLSATTEIKTIELLIDVENEQLKTIDLQVIDTEAIIADYEDFELMRVILVRCKKFICDVLRLSKKDYQKKIEAIVRHICNESDKNIEATNHPSKNINLTPLNLNKSNYHILSVTNKENEEYIKSNQKIKLPITPTPKSVDNDKIEPISCIFQFDKFIPLSTSTKHDKPVFDYKEKQEKPHRNTCPVFNYNLKDPDANIDIDNQNMNQTVNAEYIDSMVCDLNDASLLKEKYGFVLPKQAKVDAADSVVIGGVPNLMPWDRILQNDKSMKPEKHVENNSGFDMSVMMNSPLKKQSQEYYDSDSCKKMGLGKIIPSFSNKDSAQVEGDQNYNAQESIALENIEAMFGQNSFVPLQNNISSVMGNDSFVPLQNNISSVFGKDSFAPLPVQDLSSVFIKDQQQSIVNRKSNGSPSIHLTKNPKNCNDNKNSPGTFNRQALPNNSRTSQHMLTNQTSIITTTQVQEDPQNIFEQDQNLAKKSKPDPLTTLNPATPVDHEMLLAAEHGMVSEKNIEVTCPLHQSEIDMGKQYTSDANKDRHNPNKEVFVSVYESRLESKPLDKISNENDNKNRRRYNGEVQNGVRHGYGIEYFEGGSVYKGNWGNDRFEGQGTMVYNNGNEYHGNWHFGKKDGMGTMIRKNGNKYTGEWREGRREGDGEEYFAEGSVYKGQFKNNQSHGDGTYYYADGRKYIGQFAEDRIEGFGIMYYIGDEYYEGNFLKNKRNGKGKYRWKNGDIFEGMFCQDHIEGYGVYHYNSGGIYEGQFQNGKKEGHGSYNSSDGSTYDGSWHNGKFHGYGEMKFPNGDIYKGNWRNDEKDGRGKIFYEDGDTYEGEWRNSEKNGKGVMFFQDGDWYEGDWIDGKKDGEGVYNFKDCSKYEGEFKDDALNGLGTLMDKSGCTVYQGFWKNGQPFNSDDISPLNRQQTTHSCHMSKDDSDSKKGLRERDNIDDPHPMGGISYENVDEMVNPTCTPVSMFGTGADEQKLADYKKAIENMSGYSGISESRSKETDGSESRDVKNFVISVKEPIDSSIRPPSYSQDLVRQIKKSIEDKIAIENLSGMESRVYKKEIRKHTD